MGDSEFSHLASSHERVKISVKELELGMYVVELDKPWLDSPFLFQGFELLSEADIKSVQHECKFVYVDVSKQNKRKKTTGTKNKKSQRFTTIWHEIHKPAIQRRVFEEEFESAVDAYRSSSNLIMEFMDDVRLGKSINTNAAKQVVSKCVDSILHSPDALMWMTQLKNKDSYTSQHSMNVCILSIALGRQIKLSIEELNQVGLCGMMHDMGKMKIPLDILNKPDRLDDKEYKVMQSHTTHGWKLLMSSRNMYEGAIDVAYSHHERLTKGGYPRGLSEESLTPYTRMVAITDMYDAITSDRVYKRGENHLDAINLLTKASGHHLDPGLVIKFIECLGIYPLGSIVEMSSGEIAIVIEVNPEKKIKPKIIILRDEDGKDVPERIVDLAKLDLDASGNAYRIRSIVRAVDYDIDVRKYYENDLSGKGFAAL